MGLVLDVREDGCGGLVLHSYSGICSALSLLWLSVAGRYACGRRLRLESGFDSVVWRSIGLETLGWSCMADKWLDRLLASVLQALGGKIIQI